MSAVLAVNLGAPELLIVVMVMGLMAVPLLVVVLLVRANRRNQQLLPTDRGVPEVGEPPPGPRPSPPAPPTG